jgi:alpha-galactosidase/6-phospho-beta-glucosidase family protein
MTQVSIKGGYRRLLAAIVKEAVKDGAISFLKTERARLFFDVAGINHNTFMASIKYNAGKLA